MFTGWWSLIELAPPDSSHSCHLHSCETLLDSVCQQVTSLTMLGLIFLLYACIQQVSRRSTNSLSLFSQDHSSLYLTFRILYICNYWISSNIYVYINTYTQTGSAHTHSLFALLLWKEQWFLMNGCLLTEVKLRKIIVNQYSAENFEI